MEHARSSWYSKNLHRSPATQRLLLVIPTVDDINLRTLDYGNYGKFLAMGNPSTVLHA